MSEDSPVQIKDFELDAMPHLEKEEEEQGVLILKEVNLEKVMFGKIILNENISKSNFYTSCAYITYLGFILLSFSTLEPEYISQLGVPSEHLGKTTAGLYLIDYLIRLVFALVYGFMIDNFGRKLVMMIGLILTSLGYFAIPLLSDSIFPGYFIGKSIFSAGIIALQMLPLQADYVHNSTKGVMTGLTYGIAFLGGAFSASSLKLLRWYDFRYQTIFWIFSLIIIVAGLLLTLGIKGGNQYYRTEKAASLENYDNRATKWTEVKKAFKEIPWVTIAIIFGILGNTDLYVMTTGLIIWIKSLVGEGVDPTLIATNYQAMFFGLSFIVTAILACKVDKIPHMKLIFPILILSALGFIPIPFVKDAYTYLLYLFFAIEGIALPGILVFSTYLSIRYNPPEIRGTLSGISNGISFVGAIIVLSAGGFLHDHWRKDASFIIYWGLLVLTLISVTIVYKFMIYDKEHKRCKTNRKPGSGTLSTRAASCREINDLRE